MTGKIIEVLKNGSISFPKALLTNYKKMNITEKELLLLIYLINDSNFDPAKIAQSLDMPLPEVLTLIDSLSKKDILRLDRIENNNICEEIVVLDELYNKLALLFIKQDKQEKPKETNIYDKFEKEFARTLSPTEYQIIGAWIEEFNEELISLALKEAVFNGVSNLRYIDKILYEWQKKGITNKEEYEKNKKTPQKNETKKEVFDYDWLNE